MTPSARIAAAIEVLDQILGGQPAEQALLRWSRTSRFAGSGDRAAVRDLVFDALRRRNSLAAMGGSLTGRGLMIGALRADGHDPAQVFTGQGYAPGPLSDAEMMAAGGDVVDLPDWAMPYWRRSLGDQAEAVADAMRQRAPVWLRVNSLRGNPDKAISALAGDGIEVEADDRHPTALKVVSNERKLAQSDAYKDGLVELQDLSPQLACAALPVRPGMRVLDYCAGGGGKVLAIAGMADRLSLTAHDADPARMADLPARAKRAGARVQLMNKVGGPFDLVIADVPCSGSGTWRRTPDAKWRMAPGTLDDLLKTQHDILRNALSFVGPGGYLAYMTCSLFSEENDDQIDAFLAETPFEQVARHHWTPLEASDGFFLALLQREV
ncbi:RsmB/NOP family class I SAM-dependent RNA methyltransferase [Paracoccus sp. 11-3]|uniref:RsmB/NOP family class I SAM-dependent RNA methyltransferase n=1 Tax=Paracoccus amoyensis TaxID=2760093 RepID=A0A926J6B0_9RHOB|nr:RsmB/NOP family class I SAM-dependent RNA methyltransferase [Paracoccus amoyensis]MBC9247087.1 RsmB/NOP family class I SAM-dependent RNA methyltransferase [Paracoccus amoyensis]